MSKGKSKVLKCHIFLNWCMITWFPKKEYQCTQNPEELDTSRIEIECESIVKGQLVRGHFWFSFKVMNSMSVGVLFHKDLIRKTWSQTEPHWSSNYVPNIYLLVDLPIKINRWKPKSQAYCLSHRKVGNEELFSVVVER